MEVYDRRMLWSFVCGSVGGMLPFSAYLIYSYIDARGFNSFLLYPILWLLFEIALGFWSIKKLLNCYSVERKLWKTRWQFTLTDLISIVFFFAFLMWFFREISPYGFSTVGIWAALTIGSGYTGALLISIREGKCTGGVRTWLNACKLLFYALGFILCGSWAFMILGGAALFLMGALLQWLL